MRKSDFSIWNVSQHIARWRRRFHISVMNGHTYLVRMDYRNFNENKKDHAGIELWKRQVREIDFNLNAYSDEECMKDFRFRPREIGKIAIIIYFTSGKI